MNARNNMKRVFLTILAMAGMEGMVCAQESVQDSAKVAELSEVTIKAVSAPKGAPFAVSRIGKAQLQEFSTGGQELPYLFARTPSIMSWGENGLDTGTVYMRVRGIDGS